MVVDDQLDARSQRLGSEGEKTLGGDVGGDDGAVRLRGLAGETCHIRAELFGELRIIEHGSGLAEGAQAPAQRRGAPGGVAVGPPVGQNDIPVVRQKKLRGLMYRQHLAFPHAFPAR